MGGATQANWQHSLPADTACAHTRINLTFRHIELKCEYLVPPVHKT